MFKNKSRSAKNTVFVESYTYDCASWIFALKTAPMDSLETYYFT